MEGMIKFVVGKVRKVRGVVSWGLAVCVPATFLSTVIPFPLQRRKKTCIQTLETSYHKLPVSSFPRVRDCHSES